MKDSRSPQARCGRVPLNRFAVDFDPAHIHISAVTVTAAGDQIGEPDLVHLTEVYGIQQIAPRVDLIDVQLYPMDVADREFIDVVIRHSAVGMVADQKSTIGKLDQRTDLMEAGYLDVPSDLCTTCEIDVVGPVPERQGTRSLAESRPHVHWISLIVGNSILLNILTRGPVQLEFQIRIRNRYLIHRMLHGQTLYLLPIFSEEQWRRVGTAPLCRRGIGAALTGSLRECAQSHRQND